MDVPQVVRRKARAAGAEGWLRTLPDVVDALSARWGLTPGAAFPDATEALVLAVTCGDDRSPAVLKLVVPQEGDPAQDEATVLRLDGGDGCVRLLDDDPDLGALLLERLGPSLHALGLPLARRQQVLCDTARRVWRPAPGCGLRSGADKARWLVDHITTSWEELDRPCSEAAVDHALGCAARRVAAHDDERAVLVHGDVHEWNALRSGDGFRLVDPDGLLAEPAYDLGVLMREDPVDLLRGEPRDRARWLAVRTGLDAGAIWEWGVVERVSTGLLATRVGLQPVARQMLHAADRIASGPW
ncbi:aminoglycoside phosphotransferase family protein [Iamia majanohamensis]|uniref:Aminoglycoside phosphotransferase family protein n=1 Tax=Iamia majanohamensis TaxID=467976 RepID=A0AAE9Y2V1_9ACTN|nr:aminoglycoside phosphotransferase family protein [Iamia majanohamensis]WCO65195.1 aminoglycoside phosphotransferase family protein [Iamia majanohamensis]